MNDFADELRELIDKWREHTGTSDEDIVIALATVLFRRSTRMTTIEGELKTEKLYQTMRLLGVPDDQHSVEATYAFECAWQMGYRQSNNLVYMVKTLLDVKNDDD